MPVIMQKSKRNCFDAALSFLSYRSRSEMEMRRKLKDLDYEDTEIDTVIEKLYYYRYLDDESLANDLFDAYKKKKTYGDIYIHQKLKSRGLSSNRHLTEEDEKKMASDLLRKKVSQNPSLLLNRRRAAAMLMRRGFTTQAVMYALETVFDR